MHQLPYGNAQARLSRLLAQFVHPAAFFGMLFALGIQAGQAFARYQNSFERKATSRNASCTETMSLVGLAMARNQFCKAV